MGIIADKLKYTLRQHFEEILNFVNQVTFGLSVSLGHLCPNGDSQIEYLSSNPVEFSKM